MAIISRRLLGAAAALTAVTLLGACGGRLPEAIPQQPVSDPAPVSATPSPTPSPTPTYLTDGRYATALARIDRPVSKALAKIASGGGWSSLAQASAAADAASDQLGKLAVSDAQSADNLALYQALQLVSDELDSLNSGADGEGDKACAAAIPGVQVKGTAGVTSLAAAVKQLSADGFPAGLTVPKFPAQQNRSLANGTFLRSTDRNGNGRLTIENGGSGNAVVTLKRNGARALSIYLRKNGRYTIRGMRDGAYTVYFATGSDWDAKHKGFTTDCDYEKFDKSLTFRTSYHSTYVEYTTYTLSLYAIVGGTASTSAVAPGKFPAP